LDDNVVIIGAWETIRQNIKISTEESFLYHVTVADEECSKLFDRSKNYRGCGMYATWMEIIPTM
jgi:hypothetical protein